MELPGRRISVKIRAWVNSVVIPLSVGLFIFGGAILLLAVNKKLNQDVLIPVVLVSVTLLAVFMIAARSNIVGRFCEASIVDDGIWISDGRTREFHGWQDLESVEAAIPLPGRGWPAMLVGIRGKKDKIRLMLQVGKGVGWSTDPKDYPAIKEVAEKATRAKRNF